MHENFDIQKYMTKNIEAFVADVARATLKNPKESAYILKFAKASAICTVRDVTPDAIMRLSIRNRWNSFPEMNGEKYSKKQMNSESTSFFLREENPCSEETLSSMQEKFRILCFLYSRTGHSSMRDI